MSILNMPPPRRFLVEIEIGNDDIEIPTLVECTGEKDLVYIQTRDSPWLGSPLEQIKKWALEKEYGEYTDKLLTQIKKIEEEELKK